MHVNSVFGTWVDSSLNSVPSTAYAKLHELLTWQTVGLTNWEVVIKYKTFAKYFMLYHSTSDANETPALLSLNQIAVCFLFRLDVAIQLSFAAIANYL